MAEKKNVSVLPVPPSCEIRICPSVLVDGYWTVLNGSSVVGVFESKKGAEEICRTLIARHVAEPMMVQAEELALMAVNRDSLEGLFRD